MGQSIFDIQTQYLDIINDIESNGGEITPDIEELLAITEEDFKDKMITYGAVILTMEQECIIADAQIEKFTNKKKAKQNTIARLKQVMLQATNLMGEVNAKSKAENKKALHTEQFDFSIKTTKSVEVDPIQFTLANDKTHPYAKVKLPLELTPIEYLAIKKAQWIPTLDDEHNITKESEAMITALDKVRDCVITVQPDKKLLTSVLKANEERKAQGKELFETEDVEGVPTTFDIPGVKLVSNESIQIK